MGIKVDDLLVLAAKKLTDGVTGTGKRTWFSSEAVEILKLANDAPLAVADKTWGLVLSGARNPTWVYAKIDALDGKRLVHISRRYVGALVGKRIPIEVITDANGTTYRHDTTGTRSFA